MLIREIDQQPLDANAMERTKNQLVCLFPEGLALSEESWALIVAGWRRRRDRGDADPMPLSGRSPCDRQSLKKADGNGARVTTNSASQSAT